MPTAHVNGINMYYETHGKDEPLVLIMGLGASSAMWWPQIPALSEKLRVVIFDNRGAGRTDKPAEPYSMDLFADDTAALMDHLGIDSAHVLGASMGGSIAQQVALRHPAKLRTLILCCTGPGGAHAINMSPEVLTTLLSVPTLPPAERFEALLPLGYSDAFAATHRDILWARFQEGAELHAPPDAFQRQAMAAAVLDTYGHLPQIAAPTLVMTGSADPLVPPENSRILAERIPNAELKVFEGLRHGFAAEDAAGFNAAVLEFVGRHKATKARGA